LASSAGERESVSAIFFFSENAEPERSRSVNPETRRMARRIGPSGEKSRWVSV
jgi:hypothetical protein